MTLCGDTFDLRKMRELLFQRFVVFQRLGFTIACLNWQIDTHRDDATNTKANCTYHAEFLTGFRLPQSQTHFIRSRYDVFVVRCPLNTTDVLHTFRVINITEQRKSVEEDDQQTHTFSLAPYRL